MPKNIVVCCDGTGNGFDKVKEESNVAKLYCSLSVNSSQVCYYHPELAPWVRRTAADGLSVSGRE